MNAPVRPPIHQMLLPTHCERRSFSGKEGDPILYGQDVCFVCDAGGVGLLASARPATSHLGSQMIAKQDVFLLMVPGAPPQGPQWPRGRLGRTTGRHFGLTAALWARAETVLR